MTDAAVPSDGGEEGAEPSSPPDAKIAERLEVYRRQLLNVDEPATAPTGTVSPDELRHRIERLEESLARIRSMLPLLRGEESGDREQT